jgi:hypothetical protein
MNAKEASVAYCKILSRYSPGETDKNYENPLLG